MGIEVVFLEETTNLMTKLLFINKGILVALLFLFGCSEDSVTEPQVVHGCLDSQACNYNSDATQS